MNKKENYLFLNEIIDYAIIMIAYFSLLMSSFGAGRIAVSFFLFGVYIYKTWRRENVNILIKKNLIFFSFVALTFISVLWSQYPGSTLKASVELLATCFIGLYLGSTRSPEKVVRPISDALALYVGLSLLFGGVVAVGADGETAVTGIGGGAKNFFSDTSIACLIFSAAIAFIDLDKKNYVSALKALFVVPLCVIAVIKSNSAGGSVTMVVALALIVYLFLMTKLSTVEKVIVSLITCLSCGILFIVKDQIQDFIFHAFHKEKTLTGRAYLWYRASFYMHDKPLLGRGYFAFWNKNNVEALGLLSYFGLTARSVSGFTFHNTYIELMVELGYLGPIVFVSIVSVAILRYVKTFLTQKNLTYIGGFVYIAYFMSRSGVEPVYPAPFTSATFLMFICFGLSFLGTEGVGVKKRPAMPVRAVAVREA